MPSVLDSQSLGARFDARTEVYLSVLFLSHLCQQSNYHQKGISVAVGQFSAVKQTQKL